MVACRNQPTKEVNGTITTPLPLPSPSKHVVIQHSVNKRCDFTAPFLTQMELPLDISVSRKGGGDGGGGGDMKINDV